MNWYSYLTLAKQLRQCPDQEFRRSAISRAYYGVFNLAKQKAQSSSTYRGWITKTGADHRNIPRIYEAAQVYSVQENLVDLRALRNKADYNDTRVFTAAEVDEAIQMADDIVTDLNALASL